MSDNLTCKLHECVLFGWPSAISLTLDKSAERKASSPGHRAKPVAKYFKDYAKFSKLSIFCSLFNFHFELKMNSISNVNSKSKIENVSDGEQKADKYT